MAIGARAVRGPAPALPGLALCAALAAACSSGRDAAPNADDEQGASDAGPPTSGGGGGPHLGPGVSLDVPQTCDEAVARRSYVGCEYWPTVTPNSSLADGFRFGVAVANPTTEVAEIAITRGAGTVATRKLLPGAIAPIALPWVDELRQPSQTASNVRSALVAAGAYRLTSSVPVVVYQFNPFEYRIGTSSGSCGADVCYSYSNDASLLLPTTALRGDYRVLAWPTHHVKIATPTLNGWDDAPGFVAITATADATTVKVHTTARVRAGAGVPQLAEGSDATFAMDAGDVLVLASAVMPAAETPLPGEPCVQANGSFVLCPSTATFDPSGTRVTADHPVSVIGGHDCAMVPYDTFACDHLEESILPVEALGTEYVVSAPEIASGASAAPGTSPDGHVLRVLAAADGTTVHVEPKGVHADVKLDDGEWVEIGPIERDVVVTGTHKILVADYMVGQTWNGRSARAGDPSQSSAVPSAQHRRSYSFFAPVTYDQSFVNVVARTGATVRLDGLGIGPKSFAPIGATGWGALRWPVSGGAHVITSDDPFGITVYGYGAYTSYMYPGGLDLASIPVD